MEVVHCSSPGDVVVGVPVRVSEEGRVAGHEDVADDAHRPHVCQEGDVLEVDDLRGKELGRAAHGSFLRWLQLP